MPVSPDVFDRLSKAQPYKSEEAQTADAVKASTDAANTRESDKTSFVDASVEHIKKGFAGGAELYNAGARLFMESVNPGDPEWTNQVQKWLPPGAAQRAIVDQSKIDKEGPVAKAFGGAMEGVGSMGSMPVAGPQKVAAEGIKRLTQFGEKAVDTVVRGMGMGEGSELGKYVFGGLGDWFGGQKGEDIGEGVGSVLGGGLGAQANVMRVKGMGQVTKGVTSSVTSIYPAIKDTIAAKRSGDVRGAFEIFMDHYSDLKSKGMGLLQESTNEKVAAIIQRDPRHQEEIKSFNDATKQADVDAGLFSTGQKAANPTLTQAEIQQKRTKEEAAAADAKKKGQQSAIAGAYRHIADKPLPLGTKAFDESMNLYRAGTIAKADNIAKASTEIQKAVPNWSDTQAADAGTKLRDIYDAEQKTAKEKTGKEYNAVYDAADASGFRADLTPVVKETKEILKPLIAQIDKGTVPESIRSLNRLLTKEARASAAAKEADENVPFYMKRRVEPSQVKGHSFKEVDDVLKQLSADAHDAFLEKTSDGRARGNNLNKIGEAITAQLEKQAPKEVSDAYTKARANYANQYAPRFKEGVNYNLDREATAANKGREKITDQNIWPQYLNKRDLVDKMQQFDTLFGGNHGSPRNEAAFKGLSEAVGDRYSKEVLQGGFTREKHEKFMREYNSAFEQVPDARKSVEAAADQLDKLNNDKEVLLDQYKAVIGEPLVQQLGPVQAQQLLLQSLADPVKMKQVLESPLASSPEGAKSVLKEAMTFADPMKNGVYDQEKLYKLLSLGERRPGELTPLQMLFNKAMGPEEGAKHSVRLQAIMELMKREAMTDAKFMRFQPQGEQGPIQSATGQGFGNWISQFYAMGQGRVGKPWLLGVAAGRFTNNSMQKAATQAMERALYDPAMSDKILELVQTPSNMPISRCAWNAVFGAADGSSKVLRDLMDHGMIRATVARGMLYGHQQNVEDDREKDKKGPQPRRQLRMPRSTHPIDKVDEIPQ